MTDQQCGLCLSCGAPFMPDIEEVDFFNREANLSMLFLNTQFKQNPDIQRMYNTPKLCSERQASHIFHRSYHETALNYMCYRHYRDRDVSFGVGPGAVVAGAVVADALSAPFLYYHTATGNQGPKAATWTRPARANRLDMYEILDVLDDAHANNHQMISVSRSQLGLMYDICAGCNALMTQKSHMRFLLGCRNAGSKNVRGRIVPRDAFLEYNVDSVGVPLANAYGSWQIRNLNTRRAPRLTKTDSDAPAIAYYLHMCLPFQDAGTPDFFTRFRGRVHRVGARCVFLELCWVVLEIACLATLNDEGTVTKPRNSKKSHGQHQHLGVLDLYVSYFLWRLSVFCMGNRGQLDFVQFHQKYFCDARNCPGLLSEVDRALTTGKLMYNSSNRPARSLVELICFNLIHYYKNDLLPLLELCTGGRVARPIENYFLPYVVVRVLRMRSTQVILVFVCLPFLPLCP